MPEASARGSDADREPLTALLSGANVVLTFCVRELIFFLYINSASSRGFAHILLRENKLTIEHDKGLINFLDLICSTRCSLILKLALLN